MGATLSEQIKINDRFWTPLPGGMQSVAYSNGEDILKIALEPDQILERAKRNPALSRMTLEEAKKASTTWKLEISTMGERLKSGRVDGSIFADLVIDDNLRMFQKKVWIVEDQLQGELPDDKRMKELIDKFADIHLKLWAKGICETECSLLTNYGIVESTDLLTVPDFGSVSFEYSEAIRSVGKPLSWDEVSKFMERQDRTPESHFPDWFAKGQVREALGSKPDLLRYYVETMSKALTVQKLELFWPDEHKST